MKPPSNIHEKQVKSYRVGTLVYTFPGLLLLMLWLLWGDFCFSLMEGVFPSVMPLVLEKLEAPNWLIALFLSTIPNLLNATICPAVSFWSDRYRSPLGRRIPFILYTIPFLCLFLSLLGLAPHLATWMHQAGWINDYRVAALSMIGLFTVGYQFFNMFVASVYYYLFNDVVPHEFLGRFLALFRVVGVTANAFFYFFVFPKAEIHFLQIFVGAAIFYGVVFVLMCRNVKEGQYPPPSVPVTSKVSIASLLAVFFRECFTHSYYWWFYLAVAFSAIAITGDIFLIFFAHSVGVVTEQYAHFMGASAIFSALFLIPCGILCDRFKPLRVLVVAETMISILAFLPLIFLFNIPSHDVFTVWCIVFGISVPFTTLSLASNLPTYMQVLPQDRFGQFSASTALIRSVAVLMTGFGCGMLLDHLGTITRQPQDAYRFLPFWGATFRGLGAFCLWILYKKSQLRERETIGALL